MKTYKALLYYSASGRMAETKYNLDILLVAT